RGRFAVGGPFPPRRGRPDQGGLGVSTARPARRPATHLHADSKRPTQARRRPGRLAAIRPHSRRHSGSTRMNESTLTQLKIIVERAVRPVRATTSRKRKMREELLAHVTAVFEEEATLHEESVALARMAVRFGDV